MILSICLFLYIYIYNYINIYIYENQCRGGHVPRKLGRLESTSAPIPYPDDIWGCQDAISYHGCTNGLFNSRRIDPYYPKKAPRFSRHHKDTSVSTSKRYFSSLVGTFRCSTFLPGTNCRFTLDNLPRKISREFLCAAPIPAACTSMQQLHEAAA